MSKINYIVGDATNPQGEGIKIICHICNNIGLWGKGFVMTISKKWRELELYYRRWYSENPQYFKLGNVEFIYVEDGILVANMIAQSGVRSIENPTPIKYDALKECLTQVADRTKELKATIHMPRIGCGLAGGTWDKVEPIITECLVNKGIEVTVYDLV